MISYRHLQRSALDSLSLVPMLSYKGRKSHCASVSGGDGVGVRGDLLHWLQRRRMADGDGQRGIPGCTRAQSILSRSPFSSRSLCGRRAFVLDTQAPLALRVCLLIQIRESTQTHTHTHATMHTNTQSRLLAAVFVSRAVFSLRCHYALAVALLLLSRLFPSPALRLLLSTPSHRLLFRLSALPT